MHILFIKIGGSIITDKQSRLPRFNTQVTKKLLSVIFEYEKSTGIKVVLGHGVGSFGHYTALEFLREIDSLNSSQIESRLKMIHAEVRLLANEVHSIAQSCGFEPELISPSKEKNLSDKVLAALKNGKFPIIHGDVDFDNSPHIVSTEEQFIKLLESGINPVKIILATNTDGVTDNLGNTIPLLNKNIASRTNSDATGGMYSKINFAFRMLDFCKDVVIINGKNLELELNNSKNSKTQIAK